MAIKKQSRLKKIIGIFNPTTRKGGMALFVLVFVLIGGGYMAYRSFAASFPPNSLTDYKNINNVVASDGYVGSIRCVSVYGSTNYGPVAKCLQLGGGANKGRFGFYSILTKKFTPGTGWLKITTSGWSSQCSNMDYYFWGIGTYVAQTIYGEVSFGQIYRPYSTGWQIKWATKSLINGSCSTTGEWMKATAWN